MKILPKYLSEDKKTQEYYIKLIEKDKPLVPLSRYKSSKENVYLLNTKCGHSYWQLPGNSYKKNRDCPICSKNRKDPRTKSIETFKNEIYEKNPSLEITGDYINAHTPLHCKCLICGNEWDKTPNALLNYYNCNKCIGKYRYTPKEFLEKFLKIGNSNIELLEDYFNADTNILCKCKLCGKEWKKSPYDILNGSGCGDCFRKQSGIDRRKSHNKFILEMKMINPDVEILGTYITCKDNIETKCLLCGNIWNSLPSNLLRGSGCPKCVSSFGEIKVKEFLDKYNVNYRTRKTYEDLLGIHNGLLSYDFYLPKYNLLIEVQGEQHESPQELFGGEFAFKKQQEHDKRKREYAQFHDIDLLEIWYYDIDNIDQILKEKLNLETVETAG